MQGQKTNRIEGFNTNGDNIFAVNAKPNASIYTPFTEEEFEVKRALNKYCKAASIPVWHANTKCLPDDRALPFRKSIADETARIVFSDSILNQILYTSHLHPVAGRLVNVKCTTPYGALTVSPIW